MNNILLDASALLAVLHQEPGHVLVEEVFPRCAISSVNYAEVWGKLVDKGISDGEVGNVLDLGLEVVPFDAEVAAIAGSLVRNTRSLGLSLGDRACLATALQGAYAAVLTADKAWAGLDIGLRITIIR